MAEALTKIRNPELDKTKELKALDDTKAGVKGLVDHGVVKIPQIFIHPNENPSSPGPNTPRLEIPVVDLAGVTNDLNRRSRIVGEVLRASQTAGFFQLVNHGIPINVLDEMIQGVRSFHEQPKDVKAQLYTRDVHKKVRYNSASFDLFSESCANWRDTLYLTMAPKPEELPVAVVCRDIIMEFSKHVQGLGITLFELLSEALGLDSHHLKHMGYAEVPSILCHYYPPCPEPELTMGTSKHTDADFFTLLLQDHIGGLQVVHQNRWVEVVPVHGALVVNIGDYLQLLSNNKLKSCEHRVRVINKVAPRISVACFFMSQQQPKESVIVNLLSPIKELLSEENPAVYRETSVQDYVAYKYRKGADEKSSLAYYKL